jgi:hypothetical protein
MWTERAEVERSIRELALDQKLRAIPDREATALYGALEERFSSRTGARWIWEHFRGAHAFLTPSKEQNQSYQALRRVVPAANDLLFIPGSDEDDVCAFRGDLDSILLVIGDCPYFEYCIFPSDLCWLVGENHHGSLFAAGEPVTSRLASLRGALG